MKGDITYLQNEMIKLRSARESTNHLIASIELVAINRLIYDKPTRELIDLFSKCESSLTTLANMYKEVESILKFHS